MKLYNILFENFNIEKEMYGSNFLYNVDKYNQLTGDGLPKYGITFSEFEKWGINPGGKWFPRGVYFYYMHPKCKDYGVEGTGFAADRPWANVAELDLDKFLIVNPGGSRNFNDAQFGNALENLRAKYGDRVPELENVDKVYKKEGELSSISNLFNIIFSMENDGIGSFNKLLHTAGYHGILDMSGDILPIESCQGVETWPGAATYIESIQTPSAIGRSTPKSEDRRKNIYRRLQNLKNGSLVLSDQDFVKLVNGFKSTLPKGDTDNKYHLLDFLGYLFEKIDLTNYDRQRDYLISNYIEDYGTQLFDSFERNPTTPRGFWEDKQYSRYEDIRMAAKEKLNSD